MIKFVETATRIILSGPAQEMRTLYDYYSYKPEKYYLSSKYVIWKQHQAAIHKARESGNLHLAQALEAQHRGWDGWLHIIKLSTKQTEPHWIGHAPRGHLVDMLGICENRDYQVDTNGLLKNPFDGVVLEDIPDDLICGDINQEQWEMQKRCLLYWFNSAIGRVKVTVSGGKTAMFCAAAEFIKRSYPNARILYLTPTERLVKQVYKEAQKFLPDWDISQFGGAERNDKGKDMVVCTAAILNKRLPQLIATKWITSFMAVFVDENQYALSPSYQKILGATSAFFRYSASDTEKVANPEASRALTGTCGKVGARIEAEELITLDRIATPTIKVLEHPAWYGKFRNLDHVAAPNTSACILEPDWTWTVGTYLGPVYELDGDGEIKLDKKKRPIEIKGRHSIKRADGTFVSAESRWCLLQRKYDQAIINFTERNNAIAEAAADYSRKGWPTVVIATRTIHVLVLQSLIANVVGSEMVRILFSAHSSEERDQAFDWLRQTPGAVLVTPLVKVGVSINQLVGGVVADFVADFELLNQMVGRFIRRKPDGTPNEAEITIFFDNQHPSYYKTSSNVIEKLQTIKGYKWIREVRN